jgi:hypothetical protein
METALIPRQGSRGFLRWADALLANVDDEVCKRELLAMYTRVLTQFGWSVIAQLPLPQLARVAPLLPETPVAHLIAHIRDLLALKRRGVHRREDYAAALASARVLLPVLGVERLAVSCERVLDYVEAANDLALAPAVVDFTVHHAHVAGGAADLVKHCSGPISAVRTEITRPCTCLSSSDWRSSGRPPWSGSGERCPSGCGSRIGGVAIVMLQELSPDDAPGRELAVRMSGDSLCKLELRHRGRD